jgi:protein-disulfide isomerase
MSSSLRPAHLPFALLGLLLAACSTPAQVPAGTVKRPATCAEASLTLPSDAVVATLAGKPVTMKDLGDDVAKAEGKALREYCDSVHAARAGALDGYVTQQLVEGAAKAANQTPDEWVQAQVEKRATAPTDAEIQAFYDQRKRPDAPPLEAVRDQVVAILSRERNLDALQKLFEELKKDGQLVETLPDVRAPAVQIETTASTPVKGTRGAKVKVVEFADFECPYCSRAAESVKEIATRYGDKIEVSYRHFPLRQIHPSAQRASEVAVCAGEQGKFWEMHDELYSAQQELQAAIGDGLLARAQKLQLDPTKLTECLASGRATTIVDADAQVGSELGVEGTPSIFVNGRQVPGGATVEAIAAAIDAEL